MIFEKVLFWFQLHQNVNLCCFSSIVRAFLAKLILEDKVQNSASLIMEHLGFCSYSPPLY